jgi:hypothetical protein
MFLNSFYVQKSKLMLYPLLQFATDALRPKQTFIAYRDEFSMKHPSIICAYERENTEKYYEFRNKVVFNNQYFVKHIRGLQFDYSVFDLKEFGKDYLHFLEGQYSKFSENTKEIILEAYSKTTIGPILVDTHLNPEKYHELFAKELNTDIESLTIAHETLSPPDFDKEIIK